MNCSIRFLLPPHSLEFMNAHGMPPRILSSESGLFRTTNQNLGPLLEENFHFIRLYKLVDYPHTEGAMIYFIARIKNTRKRINLSR